MLIEYYAIGLLTIYALTGPLWSRFLPVHISPSYPGMMSVTCLLLINVTNLCFR